MAEVILRQLSTYSKEQDFLAVGVRDRAELRARLLDLREWLVKEGLLTT